MTPLDVWVQTPAAKALGWTLVHSLWEGAAIALVLAAALCVIRSSRGRYAAACLAMLVLMAGFGLTFTRMLPRDSGQRAAALEALAIPLGSGDPSLAAKSPQRRAADSLPWLATIWIAGVLIFQLRTLASWMAAQRLRRTGVCCAHALWQQRLATLGARVRLTRPVTLLESCLADVPVVIGYVRPVILMPVGLLAGLPTGQIDSILLHELAHICRYDYLVNLLQSLVEGLLFYHPAVWWISRVIRVERENCCDDLVVSSHGDAHEYAVALAALEQNRCASRAAALAATGGNLVKRIGRLLDQREGPRPALMPVLSAGALTISAALVVAGWQSKPLGDAPHPAAAAAPTLQAAPVSKPALKLLAQAQVAPARRPDSSPYEKWLNEDVVYIVRDEERAAFKALGTDEERKQFIEQFWLRRDPTPGTTENEFKEEHYRRIAYSMERFGTAEISGWKTDRGRTYIIWGPPDQLESHPLGEASGFSFEKWRYRYLEGVGNDVIIEFVDKTKSGNFQMTTDPREKEGPGQPGGRVFLSTEPGAQVTVEITSDRRMVVSIPIDFEAKQYLITGATRAPDGRKKWFRAVAILCKDAPGQLGCLERPLFQPGFPHIESAPLEPGSYEFEGVVKDSGGPNQKTYTVKFYVN
jgi:GWxTD domain-containing protein